MTFLEKNQILLDGFKMLTNWHGPMGGLSLNFADSLEDVQAWIDDPKHPELVGARAGSPEWAMCIALYHGYGSTDYTLEEQRRFAEGRLEKIVAKYESAALLAAQGRNTQGRWIDNPLFPQTRPINGVFVTFCK